MRRTELLPASAHHGSTSWRRWQICRRLAWCCRRTRVFFLPFSSLPYLLPCLVLCSIRRCSASAKRVAAEQVARVCVLGRRWTTWSHARRRATGAAHLIGRDTTGAHTARSLWRDTHRPLRLLLVRIHRPLRLLLMRVHRPLLLLHVGLSCARLLLHWLMHGSWLLRTWLVCGTVGHSCPTVIVTNALRLINFVLAIFCAQQL